MLALVGRRFPNSLRAFMLTVSVVDDLVALLVIAVAFGAINVVGGFLVTDRMLGMFKSKPTPPKTESDEVSEPETRV